jgi:plastocyanin
MKKKMGAWISLGVLLSIICLALVGCGGGSGGDNAPVVVVDCSTVTSVATVTASSAIYFNPKMIPISVNGVVRWISDDAVQEHTVTSGIVYEDLVWATTVTPDGKFDQSLSSNGSTVCLKFTAAGSYSYYCKYHYSSGMTGIVKVTP